MPGRLLETIDLFFRDSAKNSDKEYHLWLEEQKSSLQYSLYRVGFCYGRRGSSMPSGTKTGWLSYDEATRIKNEIAQEKLAKGYHFAALPADWRKPAARLSWRTKIYGLY